MSIELKINSYSSNWEEPKKIVFLYDVYEMISKLKSYCEIEIYLHHLAETIGKSKKEIFKDFNSRYVDRNKDAANFVFVKYSRGIL